MQRLRAALVLAALLFAASSEAAIGTLGGRGSSGALPRGDVICDLTTGVATGVGAGTCVAHPATCNGVANDAQAFADFLTWANLTWQASNSGLVELYIPSGKTCLLSSTVTLTSTSFDPGCASGTYPFTCFWNSSNFAKGIKHFLLNFYGATITAGSGVILVNNGGDGVCHNGIASTKGCSARTATVSSGASQVTLLDTSLCGRFTAGQYAVMTGFATQALYSAASAFGYPPNFQFFDYVIITSTTNCASTGVVTFDRPLTNDYKSTWPNNAPGTTGEADQAGPATLYMLPFWWDSEAEYRGGTMDNQPNQTNGAGRSTTYRDFTWLGSACAYPTQAISWSVIGGNWSTCDVEMDKIVVTATFQSAILSKLNFQSSSPRYTYIDSSTINTMNGGSRNTIVTNTSFPGSAFFVGPSGFGAADLFNCTNCIISASNGVESHGASENGSVSAGVWSISGQSGGPYSATMTNGIITVPNIHGAVTWAAPGSNVLFEFTSGTRYVYQILDITQDPTNQYVTTNCVGVNTVCGVGGGFPVASGSFKIRSHPAPKFNCISCTGSSLVTALSNGPANAPLYSYANYTVDVNWPIGSTPFVTLWGAFSTITLTVNSPYAGVGGLGFNPIYQFGGPTSQVMSPTGSTTNYQPFLDLKTAGTRTITPSGVTGGGGADSLALPIPTAWYGNQTQPNITSHPAWAGTAQITIQTDQGVVAP